MYTVAAEKELHLSRLEINKTLIATEQPYYFAENLNPNKVVDRREDFRIWFLTTATCLYSHSGF